MDGVIHPDWAVGVSRGHSSPRKDEGLNGEEWRVGRELMSDKRLNTQLDMVFRTAGEVKL